MNILNYANKECNKSNKLSLFKLIIFFKKNYKNYINNYQILIKYYKSFLLGFSIIRSTYKNYKFN